MKGQALDPGEAVNFDIDQVFVGRSRVVPARLASPQGRGPSADASQDDNTRILRGR